jgi:hypothetical protein
MSAMCQKQTHAPQQKVIVIRSPRRRGEVDPPEARITSGASATNFAVYLRVSSALPAD